MIEDGRVRSVVPIGNPKDFLAGILFVFFGAAAMLFSTDYLIGSAAQGVYEHGISDVDVMIVSRTRHPEDARRALGERLVHQQVRRDVQRGRRCSEVATRAIRTPQGEADGGLAAREEGHCLRNQIGKVGLAAGGG